MSDPLQKLAGIEKRICVNGHAEVIRVDNGDGTLQRICLHPDCDYSVADEWETAEATDPKGEDNESVLIDVQKHYSQYLGGRFARHGAGSAEGLRDKHLLPALAKGGKVHIHFGTALACPSFTEELFGGLVRAGISEESLRERLKVTADMDEEVAENAWNYIAQAADHQLQKRTDAHQNKNNEGLAR